jgi:ketosteroid isomerase-like protein
MRLIVPVALLLALRAAPLSAQLLPGGRSVDVDLQRSQFNGVMLKSIRTFTQAWQDAWPIAGSANRLVPLYSQDATIVQMGGALVSGSTAIRGLTDSLRTRIREATLAFTDYEASEGIAYVYGPLTMETRQLGAPAVAGQHLTVLKREDKGFRIRSQLFVATEGPSPFPRLPALHPSGPLTVQAMANRTQVARFRSANDLLITMRAAWSRSDTTALFALLSENALIQLPGQAAGTVGQTARRALASLVERSSNLHLVTLDYDASGRLIMLIGQYYLELAGQATNGYVAFILVGSGQDWKVRSLVFANRPATADNAGSVLRSGPASTG